jgi:hypothetical protein
MSNPCFPRALILDVIPQYFQIVAVVKGVHERIYGKDSI